MKLRKIVSLNMVMSFVLLLATSVVLYIEPEGRVAYWSEWTLLGLSKTQWGNLHIVLGVMFVLGGFVHIYLNWKPILNYMRNRAREFRMFTAEFNVALVITVLFGLGTYFALPPFQWILDLSESIKESASREYGEPPYGHAELTGLSLLARRVDLDPEECLARLRAAGIQVKSPNQPVIEVAHANGLTPKLVYEAMQPPASEGPRPLSEEPPMGIGRQTLGQISATYGLELEELLRFFRERGLAPRKESTLRQLAEEKGVPSKQLYGELREHFAR
jgi:hypothetical protein